MLLLTLSMLTPLQPAVQTTPAHNLLSLPFYVTEKLMFNYSAQPVVAQATPPTKENVGEVKEDLQYSVELWLKQDKSADAVKIP